MNTHFATSQRNDMRPLAFEGILATDCYAQLHDFLVQNDSFLKKHGMPDAAVFLAEPMCDAASGQIDWYTTATGTPTPIASLPPKEQTALRAKTARYLAVLKALTESAAGKNNKMAAALLALALRHPSEQDIYAFGSTPVLINWGFGSSSSTSSESIMLLVDKEQPKPADPAPNEPSEPAAPAAAPVYAAPVEPQIITTSTSVAWTGCLAWLLPFILFFILLWLLLSMLGILPSPPLPSPGIIHDAGMKQELARSRNLQEQAIKTYANLQTRHLQCLSAQDGQDDSALQPKASAPQNAPAQPGNAAQKPQASAPHKAPVQPGAAMQIPEDAAKNKDLSFLDGCWHSAELRDKATGESVEVEYCFLGKGVGRRRIIKKSGETCSGEVYAEFSNSGLTMVTGEARCPSGTPYVGQAILCKGNGASTHCLGMEFSDDSSSLWDAAFTRK